MKKNTFIAAACACLLAFSAAQADEAAMKQALAAWNQRMTEYRAALSLATTDEQRAALPAPAPEEIAPALWKAVRTQTGMREVSEGSASRKKGKKDEAGLKKAPTYEFEEEWAAPAVIWFINHPDAFAKLFEKNPARLPGYAEALLNSVKSKHYSSPLIAEACPKLAESSSAQVYEIVEKIFERNPSPAARGCAALALSIMLENPTLSSAEGGMARVRSKRVYYIKQALNLAPSDTEFGAVSLTAAAEEQIYRLRNLAIGAIPPQIKVKDEQGKAVTLPVQGKPHLIFFWSPAEDVGLSIMSKQERLLNSYPNLELCPIIPFTDEEGWEAELEKAGITHFYMDDAAGTAGAAYRVAQLPHAVLVSENARILYSGYPDMQLQTALTELFRQGKAAPAPPTPQPVQKNPHDTPPTLREMPAFSD